MDYITLFTPYSAIIGGMLIGVSATFFLWLNGRISGISGIIHGLVPPEKGSGVWRLAYILGLFIGGFTFYLVPAIQFELRDQYSIYLLLLGGVLVGFGTRMGSGCTSGHGVCGIARLSKRSIIATLTFMTSAVITVYIMRHVAGVY